jgi:hypothetical protein
MSPRPELALNRDYDAEIARSEAVHSKTLFASATCFPRIGPVDIWQSCALSR